MVKASRPAANQFSARPISITDSSESTTPRVRASAGWTRPAGTGRARVRRISPSMSASYHMFSAPEAPAPTAIASTATPARIGFSGRSAHSSPVSAVNTTSDITRGFSSTR